MFILAKRGIIFVEPQTPRTNLGRPREPRPRRCLPDASQMSPRCLPECRPDYAQMLQFHANQSNSIQLNSIQIKSIQIHPNQLQSQDSSPLAPQLPTIVAGIVEGWKILPGVSLVALGPDKLLQKTFFLMWSESGAHGFVWAETR